MRCHICDCTLSEKEVNYNKDHNDFEPCTTCLDIINDIFEPLSEDEISELLEEEWPDLVPSDNSQHWLGGLPAEQIP